MCNSNTKQKEACLKFLNTLPKEEYLKFLNAESQEEFSDVKLREKYLKFLNAKSQVKFLKGRFREEYQIRYNKLPNIKSRGEFWTRFLALYDFLDKKNKKSIAEEAMQKRLRVVIDYIEKHIPIPGDKDSLSYTLPYFEIPGGWEMMNSDIGKEATDLLYYFVRNY